MDTGMTMFIHHHGWFFPPLLGFMMMMIFIFLMIAFFRRRRYWRWGAGYPRFWCGPATWGYRYTSDPSETSLDILNKRYAKGEISKDEYDEMKDILQD